MDGWMDGGMEGWRDGWIQCHAFARRRTRPGCWTWQNMWSALAPMLWPIWRWCSIGTRFAQTSGMCDRSSRIQRQLGHSLVRIWTCAGPARPCKEEEAKLGGSRASKNIGGLREGAAEHSRIQHRAFARRITAFLSSSPLSSGHQDR